MYTLRYLILVLLFSAVASSAAVPATQAVDGYQATSGTVYFAGHSQEHEGDEPDGILTNPDLITWRQPARRIGSPQGKAIAFYYGDYLARAPPQFL